MPVAFENSVKTFLTKMVSDVKTQGAAESQLLEEESEIRDVVNENSANEQQISLTGQGRNTM